MARAVRKGFWGAVILISGKREVCGRGVIEFAIIGGVCYLDHTFVLVVYIFPGG